MSTGRDRITVSLPVDVRYISVARLVTAGAAAQANLTVEAIEDLKIAVSEACTNVGEHAFADQAPDNTVMLTLYVSDGELTVEVEDEGRGFDPKHLPDMDKRAVAGTARLGLYLIREMMDELNIQSAPGSGTKIVMTKRSAR